jgi:hypothetical protein
LVSWKAKDLSFRYCVDNGLVLKVFKDFKYEAETGGSVLGIAKL